MELDIEIAQDLLPALGILAKHHLEHLVGLLLCHVRVRVRGLQQVLLTFAALALGADGLRLRHIRLLVLELVE